MKLLKMNFANGLLWGLLAWLVMTLADALDEFVFDCDSGAGYCMCIAFPVLFLILYWVSFRKNRPELLACLKWFVGYLLTGVTVGLTIIDLVVNGHFIPQRTDRCYLLCLNGVEYYIFAITVLGFFTVICILIHGIVACYGYKKSNRRNG